VVIGLSSCSSNLGPSATALPSDATRAGSRTPQLSEGPAPCVEGVSHTAAPLICQNPPDDTQPEISYLSYTLSYPRSGFGAVSCKSLTCFISLNVENGDTIIACDGTPSSCVGIPCVGSPTTIGDIIPGPTSAGVRIDEINSLWYKNGAVPVGGQTYGWLYIANGAKLFQPNYANADVWSGSLGITLGGIFGVSVGITGAGGYGAIVPWNGSLPASTQKVKCESKGGSIS